MTGVCETKNAHISNIAWIKYPPGSCYECRVALLEEPEGGFSVYAVSLPGVCSQGETEEEAIANIRDALTGAIHEYLAAGEIPWCDAFLEPGCIIRHLVVNLNETPAA